MGKKGKRGWFGGDKAPDVDKSRERKGNCHTCNGKRTVERLTDVKDKYGQPITEKVPCPDC